MTETPVLPITQPSSWQSSLAAGGGRELSFTQVAETLVARAVSGDELDRTVTTNDAWLWHGYLAPGNITLLTSQWKSGKTTLIAVLLAKMTQGGELAGLPVKPGRAAIVSEEGLENWKSRCHKLQVGNHLTFFCRPFRAKPTLVEWQGLMEAMLMLKRRDGLDLVVIDPLVAFLPGDNENTAGVMLRCLQPLRELTAAGISVLLLHHPRKGPSQPGQAARGSGALPSHVDILLEMHWNRGPDDDDRRRRLYGYSRHEETRRSAVIELVPDGTDYVLHNLVPGAESSESWDVLFMVLREANDRLTQRQIIEEWPEDFTAPSQPTITRLLERALKEKLICKRGSGSKNHPFQYWLPEIEDGFKPGPLATPEEKARFGLYWRKKVCPAFGLDPESYTLEDFLPKYEPNPEPEPAVAGKEDLIIPAEPEPDPEPPPTPASPAMPIMPPSPTEYIPVETAPLPPGILRPPPPVDEAALEAERIRLRIRR